MNKEALIEKYFSHQLSDAEFNQLKKWIEEDELFKNEFYQQLEIQKTISEANHSQIKERLKRLDNRPKKKNIWYLYAASVTILIILGLLFYKPQQELQGIYAENFEVYPNVINITTRSGSDKENEAAQAFQYYEKGLYGEAVLAFNEAYKNHPEDYLLFYKGVSLLAQHKTNEGINVLLSYDWEKNQSEFAEAANWYLGLAYIKQEQLSIAKLYLQKVMASETHLQIQAQNLLKELD
ncbi:tetratricopeptide repeat protein [Xanthomarina gelatinilytica]|uniref:tetratricopeptide repeat protein n=1 Tax=Xanthomarina gelatinilytica TaxID=1137281 RepID=UPI003AA8DFD1